MLSDAAAVKEGAPHQPAATTRDLQRGVRREKLLKELPTEYDRARRRRHRNPIAQPSTAMSELAQMVDIQRVVSSLTESLTASELRASAAEEKLVSLQAAYTEAALALGPAQKMQQRLELEKEELKQQHEAQRRATAASNAETEQLRGERDVARAVLQAVQSASEVLVPRVCELLLQAQEARADEPRLEADRSRLASPTGAFESERKQRLLVQANFEAALSAFGLCCRRNEALTDAALRLAEPLGTLRAAMRATSTDGRDGTDTTSGSAATGNGSVDAALDTAASEWRRRSSATDAARERRDPPRAQARPSSGSGSGGAASAPRGALVSTKFDVVVPEGAAPGDTLYVSLPTGEEVKVVIPPEGAPGSLLTCSALTRSGG